MLKEIYLDFARLRRELIEAKFLERQGGDVLARAGRCERVEVHPGGQQQG